jgi:hypothetical protein
MKRSAAIATATTLVAVALSTVPVATASAHRCVSGADVRQQVSTFVHSLHGDSLTPKTRRAVKGALIESVKAARGAKADTPHENRGLGAEIRVLARQLGDTKDKVAHDALIAQIHALQDQKKAARTSGDDVQELRGDVRQLKRDLVAKANTDAQGRQVSAFVHALMAQFDC